jgi:hypothetical protein
MLAEQSHFFTAELRLRDFGEVLLIGDQAALERVMHVLGEHDEQRDRPTGTQPLTADADFTPV